MRDTLNFEGDMLFFDTPDGGEINIKDGLFVCDRAFDTAVYLSLFGGNKDDNGKVKNKNTWWGNFLQNTPENEKITSRFQYVITTRPMSTKHIQEAEKAAELDLKWMLDEKIADKIRVSGHAGNVNTFFLRIDILLEEKSIYQNAFSAFWKAGVYGGV